MRKLTLSTQPCRRCGTPVTGLDRPITGAHTTHDQYHHICERCLSPEEHAALVAAQLDAILGRT